jgi:dTMP kinase
MKHINNPKFVVFEGLDGSGTSTQAKMLEQALTKKGGVPMLTAEPSSGPIGNLIRLAFKQRLKFQEELTLFDQQMAYLFAADRFDHLYNDVDGVLSMIKRGHWVISTRYYFSSYAYHVTDESGWERVSRLNQDFPKPDLLIYLDNPIDESLRRLDQRIVKDSYENESKLISVARNYERILREYAGPKLIIDAMRDPHDIHNDIINHLGITHE